MQKRAFSRLAAAPAACLLAYFALFAVINFIYLPRFIDGDIYADMELAREIWRQKSLFPSNWVFGNQYYTVATPVLAALFYGLTGSMRLSMALATTAMSALIVWSFLWMLRPFVRERWLRLTALLLFTAAPMARDLLREEQGQLFFTLASYYACYLITLCLVFGDYARAVTAPERGLRPLPLALSLTLCFLTGMQSLRQLLIMALPILALEGLRVLRREAKGATLLRAGAYTLLNLSGYGLMKLLRVPAVTIYGSVQPGGGSLPERLLGDWHALRGVTGLDSALSSSPRAFYLLFAALTALLVPAAAWLLWKKRREAGGLGLLWLLCAVSLGGVLLAGLAVEIQMRKIYLFIWYLLLALSGIPLLRALKGRGQAAALLSLCALSLGNLWFSYGSSLRLARQRDPAPAIALCADAEAAGYAYLYGNWETVPAIAVWSDALTGGFCTEAPFQVRSSINLQDLYTEEHNDRALYVIRDWDREGFERYCAELGASYEVFGVYGEWIAYHFDEQMMQIIGEGA